MEKLEAHRKAELHRAVSVFIFNQKGQWLLQQRSLGKYHSKGLWTNTCCSHPFPGEEISTAAHRRLREEMGLDCQLLHVFSFIYKEKLDNEMTEHELDHVYWGITDELPVINDEEVMDWKYFDLNELFADISLHPGRYTVWFSKIFERVHLEMKKTGHF